SGIWIVTLRCLTKKLRRPHQILRNEIPLPMEVPRSECVRGTMIPLIASSIEQTQRLREIRFRGLTDHQRLIVVLRKLHLGVPSRRHHGPHIIFVTLLSAKLSGTPVDVVSGTGSFCDTMGFPALYSLFLQPVS